MSEYTDQDFTVYHKWIPGDAGNYNYEISFDKTGRLRSKNGYIGINLRDTERGRMERILLNPKQAKQLADFILKTVIKDIW